MEQYKYTPLPPRHKKIRLIRLQPRQSGTDIQIEIFHTKVSSKPIYEALSYTWGCPDITQTIQVHKPGQILGKFLNHYKSKNTSLGVAENLFVALRHLRFQSEPRVLWIDAICINQQDKVERSAEVLEMGSVYKNASNVIVWLGPSSNNSDLALQTLQRIGKAVTYYKDEQIVESRAGSWAEAMFADTEALRPHEDRWFAVKELILRDWWHRLWVFPEVVLARKANIVVGENYLDWGVSMRALWWLNTMSTRLDQQFQELDIAKMMHGALRWFMHLSCSPANLNLFSALEATGPMLCSDPRDRLFAIRSLLRPANAAMIVPNYSLEVEEVYNNFAKEWISRQNNVRFLSYCTFARAEPSTSGNLHLPSWVPDWSHVGIDGLAALRCSGHSRAFTRLLNGNRLGIQGVQVGKLGYVSHPTKVPATDNELRELCRSWAQLVSTGNSGNEVLEIDDCFLEVIVGGYLSEKRPSTQKNYPKSKEVRAFLAGTDDRSDQHADYALPYVRGAISGRSFFVTSTGSYGLCPESVEVGDIVAVILGCNYPLILRRDELSERTCFRVVGPCCMPGIMEVEALLGPLPAGWSSRLEVVEADERRMFTNGDTRTQQDPRMHLPPAWRYIYGDEAEEEEAKELKDMREQWFENEETGETTRYDPRLTPELLTARGVAIEEFVLI